ncbi:hypothetical protein PybrP1_003665, partial [[Pythium] brassicae (nom. inval.)]
AVDTFYFHCVQQQDALDAGFRADVLRYFDDQLFRADDARFALGETLNEAVFGAVIKLHLGRGDAGAAWAVVDRLHARAGATKLHFRTLGPILEHECRQGQFLAAFARWQRLKSAGGVSWTDAMEDTLVHMVVACSAAHYARGETAPPQFHAQMRELLRDLRLACKEVSVASAQRLRQAFRSAGYAARVLPSDAAVSPACAACGAALDKLALSAAERAQLLRAIESRRSKVQSQPGVTAKDFLAPFKTWLLAKHAQTAPGKLHFVLDGPNIAYINQNFDAGSCRLDHVDAVADMLRADGHTVSITMPFSYLAERIVLRIRTKSMKQQRQQGKVTTRARTPAEKALIHKWQAQGLLFGCRTDFLSDDLFWLYASVLLGKDGRVVTNDQGRDHVFELLNSDVSKQAASTTRSSSNKPKQAGTSSTATSAKSEADAPAAPPPPEISMDLIERWKELSIVNIEIQHQEVHPDALLGRNEQIPIEEIRLLHPLPFSRVPQVNGPENFHFPVSTALAPSAIGRGRGGGGGLPVAAAPAASSKQSMRNKWLCVHRKPASESPVASSV